MLICSNEYFVKKDLSKDENHLDSSSDATKKEDQSFEYKLFPKTELLIEKIQKSNEIPSLNSIIDDIASASILRLKGIFDRIRLFDIDVFLTSLFSMPNSADPKINTKKSFCEKYFENFMKKYPERTELNNRVNVAIASSTLTDWLNHEDIMQYIYNLYMVLHTLAEKISITNYGQNTQNLLRIFFEKFKIKNFFIADSTTITLAPKAKETMRANSLQTSILKHDNTSPPSSIKQHVLFNFKTGTPEVEITTEGVKHDHKVFSKLLDKCSEDEKIMLWFDRAYSSYFNFTCINKKQGYFIGRVSKTKQLFIVQAINKNKEDVTETIKGKQLKSITFADICQLNGEDENIPEDYDFDSNYLDLVVRSKKGEEFRVALTCRPIYKFEIDEDTNTKRKVLIKEESKAICTNFEIADIDGDDIISLYHFRWGIELYFKQLKSFNKLGNKNRSTDQNFVQLCLFSSAMQYCIKLIYGCVLCEQLNKEAQKEQENSITNNKEEQISDENEQTNKKTNKKFFIQNSNLQRINTENFRSFIKHIFTGCKNTIYRIFKKAIKGPDRNYLQQNSSKQSKGKDKTIESRAARLHLAN